MGKQFTLLVVFLAGILYALPGQQQLPAGRNYYNDEKKGIVYNEELAFDFKLLTPRSIALGVNFGDLQTYYRTRFYNLEIGNLRHSQEFRQSFDIQFPGSNIASNPFVFGKQNQFYVLRGGLGFKRYLSEKAVRRGVAVGYSYSGGPALGFLKPYYLNLIYFSDQGTNRVVIRPERYTEDNARTFLDIYTVYGAASWLRGLGEIRLLPGIQAKAALHFDWGAYEETVKAVEAGIAVDFFFREVPIMVESATTRGVENSAAFINFYINLQLGKRR